MFIQCTVLGNEPTTFRTWVPSYKHQTRSWSYKQNLSINLSYAHFRALLFIEILEQPIRMLKMSVAQFYTKNIFIGSGPVEYSFSWCHQCKQYLPSGCLPCTPKPCKHVPRFDFALRVQMKAFSQILWTRNNISFKLKKCSFNGPFLPVLLYFRLFKSPL